MLSRKIVNIAIQHWKFKIWTYLRWCCTRALWCSGELGLRSGLSLDELSSVECSTLTSTSSSSSAVADSASLEKSNFFGWLFGRGNRSWIDSAAVGGPYRLEFIQCIWAWRCHHGCIGYDGLNGEYEGYNGGGIKLVNPLKPAPGKNSIIYC